jgi:potassium efflux system protein
LLAQCVLQPLRVVLFVILMVGTGLSVEPARAAPQAAASAGLTPQLRIEQAGKLFASTQHAMDDADAPETLKTLSEQAAQAQREAESSVQALAPELAQLDARIEQLGPAPEGGEVADIARQRKALERQRDQIDAAIKRGKLLAEDARQLGEAIEKMRAQQFGEQLGRKVGSPLSPALWRQFFAQLPDDVGRFQSLYRQAGNGMRQATARHGWAAPLVGAAVALVLLFPLRLWLRHLGRRYAASERAPAGRLRRTGLAVWLLLVGTLMPWLASLAVVAGLHEISAIAPRLERVAEQFSLATLVAAFIGALAACLLVPVVAAAGYR